MKTQINTHYILLTFLKFHLKFMLIDNIVTYSFMLLRLDSPLFYLSQWSVTWCLRDQTVTPHQGKRAGRWLSWSLLKPNRDERIRPGPHHKIFKILTDTEYGRDLTRMTCSVVWLKSSLVFFHQLSFSPRDSPHSACSCLLGFHYTRISDRKYFGQPALPHTTGKSYNYRTIRIIWTFMWL